MEVIMDLCYCISDDLSEWKSEDVVLSDEVDAFLETENEECVTDNTE
ncbi:hypothetical protein TNCT_371531, partial [Trichonephila clavata]